MYPCLRNCYQNQKYFKMYVHAIYSWFRIETILSVRKHEYEFITTITIEYDES